MAKKPAGKSAKAAEKAPAAKPDLPLDISGTAFQQAVWQALREIPAGTTCDYSEIAARIGSHREAVTREMNRLEQEKFLETGRRSIRITDIRKLRRSP